MQKITSKHLYQYGWITLPIQMEFELPKKIVVEESELQLKNEFHITLMAVQRLAEMIDPQDSSIGKDLVREFVNFAEKFGLQTYYLENQFRLVKRDEKISTIQMATVGNLDKFYERLTNKYSIKFSMPPTHITLYCLQPEVGISLVSDDELEKYTQVIESIY